MFRCNSDTLLGWCLKFCAIVSGGVLFLVCAFLVVESLPVLQSIGLFRLLTDEGWYPASAAGKFNMVPMVIGTLLATAGAVVLAAPLGIISAVFCHYYAPPIVARAYRILVELLAGIPSVVYGLWGLVVLVPVIRELSPPGPSLLAGIIILTLMILPTIALLADSAISNVPAHYRHSAAALGLSRWSMIVNVILPAARSGLFAGTILGAGRAIGETMAILMVCGNIVQMPQSLFDPIRTLTANIALEMAYALGDHRSALFVSGLLLLAMIVVLAIAVENISRRSETHG